MKRSTRVGETEGEENLVQRFAQGAERKRIRTALLHSEGAARRVIRESVPDVDSTVEDAILDAVREADADEERRRAQLEKEAELFLQQDEADELALIMVSLKVADVACPMCASGDLIQHALDRHRFACDSCSLFLLDSRFSCTSDVRNQLAITLARHSDNGCSVSRPVVESNGLGRLSLACEACSTRSVIFAGT